MATQSKTLPPHIKSWVSLYQSLKKDGYDNWEEVNVISNPYSGDNQFVSFTMAEITKNALDELLQVIPDENTLLDLKMLVKHSENRQLYETQEETRWKLNTLIEMLYSK